MKKNYSHKILDRPLILVTPPNQSSPSKNKPNEPSTRKLFQRKPQQPQTSFSRKRLDDLPSQVDSTMEQTSFSGIVDKLKNVRFVSCSSQNSLTNSLISRSSGSQSFVNSFYDSIDEGQECSRILPDESIICQSPQKQPSSRQVFRRKTSGTIRTVGINKKKSDQSYGTSSTIVGRYNKRMEEAESEIKLDTSAISDQKGSFIMPSVIIRKNIVHNSKNSSKDSLRKSGSSNSIHKTQPAATCQVCYQFRRELKQAHTKNQRFERMIKNKDDEISNLNKRIQQIQKKNRELDKKLKQSSRDVQRQEMKQKIRHLQQQLTDSQDESLMLRKAYTQAIQELKYKQVENTTMKKYQAQVQSVQRKMQLVVAQRNELRQRLSSINISGSRSNYTNYPTSMNRQTRSITTSSSAQNLMTTTTGGSSNSSNGQSLGVSSNRLFKKGPGTKVSEHSGNKRQTYTSRNEGKQEEEFYGEEEEDVVIDRCKTSRGGGDGFKKKQNGSGNTSNTSNTNSNTSNKGNNYEQSLSQSQIISLSQESNI